MEEKKLKKNKIWDIGGKYEGIFGNCFFPYFMFPKKFFYFLD